MEDILAKEKLKMRRNIFSAAFFAEMIRTREAAFLFLVALISRLIAYPFSQVIDADATSRIFLAEHALAMNGELASLQWPSLHIYFLAAAQFITHSRVAGPVFLSLLMGAFSVVPFYRFTKNIFSSKGAFYTALIFTFSPLIFRLSFTPLSEIYHVCFSATALWCLSEGIVKQKNKIRWAVYAGIAATIAAGGRFEAWVLIGLLCIVLVFLREWKMMLVFGSFAAIFPVWWMIYCYRAAGSAFVSLEMVQWQNFVVDRVNENLSEMERFKRVLFFPFAWLYAITPVAAFISLYVYLKAVFKRKITRNQLAFGFLFLFFIPFFIRESITGSLADQHRYVVSWELFSLPFFALWFESEKRLKLKKIIAVVLALLMIPWSYSYQRFPWNKLFMGSEMKKGAMSEIVVCTLWETEAVPRFNTPAWDEMGKIMNANLKKDEGVFLDFAGWCETYYLAQQTPPGTCEVFILPPADHHKGDNGRFRDFFERNHSGVLFLQDFNPFSTEQHLSGPLLEMDSVPGGLLISPLYYKEHLRLFRYIYLSGETFVKKKEELAGAPPLYTPEKDVDFYKMKIHGSADWYAGMWKAAMKKWTSIETQVQLNAAYMVSVDEENKKKEKQKTDSIQR